MNKDYQIRALKGVITKQKKRILTLENILNEDSSDEYIVRYKAKIRGVIREKWGYFIKFEGRIHTSDYIEGAIIVNKNKGEEIINEINKRYDDAPSVYEIAEIEVYMINKKKGKKETEKKIISRFELMEI